MKYWESVPGWFDFGPLYSKMVEKCPVEEGKRPIFVEIGTFFGRSACYMMEAIQDAGKEIDFYCVDLFKITPDDADIGGHGGMPWGEDALDWQTRLGGDKLYEHALNYMKMSPASQCLKRAIQCDSAQAAKQFEDESVSFAFIDASHRYENVKRDLTAWWPKIKIGGYMGGHDWNSGAEVRQAVKEFAFYHGIKRLGVDRANSWLIEKEFLLKETYKRLPFGQLGMPDLG